MVPPALPPPGPTCFNSGNLSFPKPLASAAFATCEGWLWSQGIFGKVSRLISLISGL